MSRLEEIREREPMTHELKCWPEYFAAVESGAKPFEVRKWDRPFRVGDILALKEYDPEKNDYSGAELQRKITYLLDMTYLPNDNIPHFAGYVVIGLESPEISRLTAERDAKEGQAPIVAHRRNGQEWLVVMRGTDWLEMYREVGAHGCKQL